MGHTSITMASPAMLPTSGLLQKMLSEPSLPWLFCTTRSVGSTPVSPTAYGTFTVQVSVQDSSATPLRRTMPIPLLVNPAPVAAPTPVPTLGEWALGLLALLLAALGVRASALRRA